MHVLRTATVRAVPVSTTAFVPPNVTMGVICRCRRTSRAAERSPRPESSRCMATYLIALQDILTDPDNPVDLTALPEAEAVERIKQTYGYWGSLLDVRIEDGIAVIDLPDENANRAGAALDKIKDAGRAAKAGSYQQAANLYADALKVLPQHTTARRELAMVQVELGNIAAAKQNLIRVLQLDPKDAWACLLLGNIYFKHERDYGSAERYFVAAADLAPGDPYILNSYASLLSRRGRYDEAEDLFTRAIAAQPTNIQPYLGLANVADKRGDLDGVIDALDRLFDLPHDADARSEGVYGEARRFYADTVRRRAKTDEAQAQVQEALDAYTARTGIQVRIRHDPTLQTDAATRLAWRYNLPYHEIKFAGGGGRTHI